MTNNPTIDGVSRELLERVAKDDIGMEAKRDHWAAVGELRALLDEDKVNNRKMGLMQFVEAHPMAPVVERQPFGYVFRRKGPEDHGWNFFQGVMAFESMEAYEIKSVYEAPPEVAALQSTIAQLQADNERNAKNSKEWEESSLYWMAERDKLQGRIAELESGRGEPIKTPDMPYKMLPLEEDGWFQCVNAYEAMYPLFTAPPAPVALVLPDRQQVEPGEDYLQADFVSGWNACLDATAALNEPAK